MYEYVAEERTVKALALIGVLAMVGMVVTPVAVSESNTSWYLSEIALLNGVASQDALSAGLGAVGMGLALGSLAVASGGTAVAIAL